MRLVDNFLNRFTMYQLVFYFLVFFLVISFGLVVFKILPYDPVLFVQNAAVIFGTAYLVNFIFSKILNAYSNIQSTIITSLILILISPIQFNLPLWVFALIPLLAITSKYLVSYKKVHIFNPAAFGAAVVGLIFPEYAATWWVGSPILFVPVLICGLLVLRKVNRFTMALTFLATYMAISFIKTQSVSFLWAVFTQSALIFFATVMLTEPSTSPVRKKYQSFYSVLVAFLFSLPLTAEVALLGGNIFAYIVNPKYRLLLSIKRKVKITSDLYQLEFEKPKKFNFSAGQYMSWTLPHKKEDSRGNRRYFTIASSPTEGKIIISFRLYPSSSSFKKALVKLSQNDKILASNLSGDFVLPKKIDEKLVLIAGGIGVTPIRSMIKYLVDKEIKRDIIVMYVVKKKEDLIFMEEFEKALSLGIKTVPLIGKYELEEKDFKNTIPDYNSRIFYISGPQLMVQSFKTILKKLGVKKIETDFFPGYS